MTIYFGKNIKYLRKGKNLTQSALGEVFGFTNTTVSGWQNGSFPELGILLKICEYFKTDPTTLLYTDMSAMGGGSGAGVELLGRAKEVSEEINQVPLYGTVSAGAMGLAEFWQQEKPVGWVAAPEFKGCIAAFRVVGESMEPDIKGGDMVFIRSFDKETGYYSPQNIYMLVTREERMIKRVRIAPDAADVLICSSPNYQEFRLPITEVLAVYKVAGFVRVV